MKSLFKKHIIKISNFNKHEIQKIIELSLYLKKNRNNQQEIQYLKNKKIALIFEQESTRTRCAFEIAAIEQGAYSSYFGPGNMHLGYKESIIDTAKILSKMYDGIQYRGNDHNVIKILSKYASVPVWNGLTNKYHPTQLIADLLTMIEFSRNKNISEIICSYLGDASNNIGNSLVELAGIMGFQLNLIAPKKYWPDQKILNKYIKSNNIICTENINQGIYQSDFIYTDVWVSMGETEDAWKKKIELLRKYQVNKKIIQIAQNPKVKILHCLPALHDKNTKIGKKISNLYQFNDGIEITNEIFDKYNRIIFQQAENRLHTIKAILISTLTNIEKLKIY
ncbi:ornithine carbamoyltransferase [Buchnera aphidicola]|uniref:ornithine carbamoyltransferase n=1 Tax=Buchnera aphidicola TaxID=9 RepID=UPI0034640D80